MRVLDDDVAITVSEADQQVADLRWKLCDVVLAGARSLVVDVSALTCLSSDTLAALLGAYRMCSDRGGVVVLVGCSRETVDLLHRTGLYQVLQIRSADDIRRLS